METINYTYKTTGWKDILTGVGGVTYTNDTIGNRTSDGTWSYTWEHGRQLAGMTKSGTGIAYDYGEDGYRISKAVTEGGTTTTYQYFYSGGKLLHVSWNDTDRVHIFYNAGGSPISILYNGTRYYYVKNVQGDIVGLTTTSGLLRVAYTYDAWGTPLTITGSMAGTLGKVNPLRYRGYVYDTETGLYYLGSRYYDPAVGRFINADKYLPVLFEDNECYNLFVYCFNNPLYWTDGKGEYPQFFIEEYPFPVLLISADADFSEIQIRGGHKKKGSVSPHNKQRHEEGDSRRRRDQIGEKGDKRRREDRSNKRHHSISTENNKSKLLSGIMATGSLIGIILILADDITIVGITNDVEVVPMIEIFIDSIKNIIR